MERAVQPAHVEALKGIVIHGIASLSARSFPASKTFPPPAAIIESHLFYEKSFTSISSIPLRSRFSVIVARRIYKKIGDYILKQKNTINYNKAGKIYVPIYEKIFQTFLSIFDLLKLLFVKELNYDNHNNHNILSEEIKIDERI